MRRMAGLVLLAGCGRLGFEPAVDASPSDGSGLDGPSASHDEDGDGVPDATDVCPHLTGSQLDTDDDGVGDDCDWEPTNPRQHFALVATMEPGQPFAVNQGTFTQLADALHFDGVGYGELIHGVVAGDVQIDIGLDVSSTVGAGTQHQITLGATGGPAVDFGELNEQLGGMGSFSNAALTRYDGTTFLVQDGRKLPSNIHPGRLTMHLVLVPGGPATFDTGWPGEPYHLEVPATVYTGATEVAIRINNTILDLRYVVVITGG